jgi:hypothetical protein
MLFLEFHIGKLIFILTDTAFEAVQPEIIRRTVSWKREGVLVPGLSSATTCE